MSSSLVLLLVVGGGFLAAHVAFGWLARRYYVVSGAEYLMLGVLLGPQVSGLISTNVFGGFAPFLTLSLGWIGVLVGAQFYLPDLIRIPGGHFRIALAEAAVTGTTISAAMVFLFTTLFGLSLATAVPPAVVMGAVATASSPTGIAMVLRRVGIRDVVARQLQVTAAIDALVAIVVFGLLLAVYHEPQNGSIRPLTATEWAVVSVAIGVVGGLLVHLFLEREAKIDRLFIGLAGAIILASGAAAYLRLSPLLPAMLIGMMLINTSGRRFEIRQVLASVERPLYFVLLIFAGAAWAPIGWLGLVPVVGFLLLRTVAKVAGGAIGAAANGALPALGARWGLGLVGHGGLAIAIALNYQIHRGTEIASIVFSAAIASVLITDFSSARVAELVVRAARDTSDEPAAGLAVEPEGTA